MISSMKHLISASIEDLIIASTVITPLGSTNYAANRKNLTFVFVGLQHAPLLGEDPAEESDLPDDPEQRLKFDDEGMYYCIIYRNEIGRGIKTYQCLECVQCCIA